MNDQIGREFAKRSECNELNEGTSLSSCPDSCSILQGANICLTFSVHVTSIQLLSQQMLSEWPFEKVSETLAFVWEPT